MAKQVLTKPVRLKDVAARLDLSVSTISMAMAGYDSISADTKARVRRTAAELGYNPSPKKSKRCERKVVGFWAFGAGAEDEGYAALTFRLSEIANAQGMSLEVRSFPVVPALREFNTALEQAPVPAQLLVCGRIPAAHLGLLARRGQQCCLLGHVPWFGGDQPQPAVPCVSWREEEIGAATTAVLLNRGYRKIGCLCEKLYAGMSQARFVKGYRMALLEAGLGCEATWVVEGGLNYAHGETAVANLLDQDCVPEAFVAPTASTLAFYRAVLQRYGFEMREQAVAFWDVDGKSSSYGLSASTRVETDFSRMISMALHVSANPQPFAGGMVVSLPYVIVEP